MKSQSAVERRMNEGLSKTAQASPNPIETNAIKINNLMRGAVTREGRNDMLAFLSSEILADVLGMLDCPVLVVDRKLRVVFANPAADICLEQGGTLQIRDGAVFTTAEQAQAFSAAVVETARGRPTTQSLILNAPGQRPLSVWLRPVAAALQTSDVVWAHGLVVVTFNAWQTRLSISRGLLSQHYGLTRKEAEIVENLACGMSVDDMVNTMKIARSTVRSHLAKCFQKTGTTRQPDLVLLAMSLSSPLRT